jgi:beta-lactamase regulating signal transducer with metallopeptidase domain
MIIGWMTYSLIVSLALAVSASVLDRATSGALRQRRWIWVFALALSAGIPGWQLAASRLGNPPDTIAPQAASDTRAKTAAPSIWTASQLGLAELIARADTRSLGAVSVALAWAWIAAIFVAATGYAATAWSLTRRRRSWRKVVVDGESVWLAAATGPAVIGALRPTIVVPEWSLTLPPDQRALMLEHERQHVRARDPLLLQAAAFVSVLMPWNLVAWWLVRRLRLAIELDCDARVLAAGRDSRAYGNLLIDVCERRLRSGVVLAPALFERTSSLTRRILAMHPRRPRFVPARVTLGFAAALALVVLACDMPSPEAVAPDGKNQATKRLYGDVQLVAAPTPDAKGFVSEYFPAVARGEGGPTILFVVKSATGAVVLTEAKRAGEGGQFKTQLDRPSEERNVTPHEAGAARQDLVRTDSVAGTELRVAGVRRGAAEQNLVMFKVRAAQQGLPVGVSALQPNDIATVDVSKHAAGTLAPNAVSIVTIVLKPGAAVPTASPK